jgi:hypothetical protein
MLRVSLAFLCFCFSFISYSQVRISSTEILLQSRHVWRGSQLGNAIAIEPSITFAYHRFSINVWAALTPNNSYSEVDMIPSYSCRFFKLSLLNYYNPVQGEVNQYLNFREGKSRHSLELALDNYSVDTKGLKWMAGTFLAGDRNKITGKSLYSTYLEFRYPFAICKIDVEPFAGITPFRGYYADQFAVINTGLGLSKELDLNLPFKIPLSLTFTSNPYSRKSFVIVGMGIEI